MPILDAFIIKSSSVSDGCPQRHGRQVARIASLTVISIGCAVLIGWQLDLGLLKSLVMGLATMKANAAVCFIWAGISLLLQTRQRQGVGAVKMASLCAMAVIFVAFLTICQYVFRWNLGIDELLFADPDSPGTSHPGRMGINTAVNFCWLGTALWLINRWRSLCPGKSHPFPGSQATRGDWISIAQGLTIGAMAIAIQAMVGYAYNVQVFYRRTGGKPPHSCVGMNAVAALAA